jgi:hypothetical protein
VAEILVFGSIEVGNVCLYDRPPHFLLGWKDQGWVAGGFEERRVPEKLDLEVNHAACRIAGIEPIADSLELLCGGGQDFWEADETMLKRHGTGIVDAVIEQHNLAKRSAWRRRLSSKRAAA